MRKREFETDRGTLRYWVSENDEETAQLVFLPGLTAPFASKALSVEETDPS